MEVIVFLSGIIVLLSMILAELKYMNKKDSNKEE